MVLKFRSTQFLAGVVLLVSLAGLYAVYSKMFQNFTTVSVEAFNLVVNIMFIFLATISLMFLAYSSFKAKHLIDTIPEIDENIANNASYLSYDVINMLPESSGGSFKVKEDVKLENFAKTYVVTVIVSVLCAGGSLIVLALQKL